MLLPAMGIVAEVMTVFARKKLFAYKTVIYTVIATGVLSFFVWAHHQFVAGIDPRMANVFTVTTVLISIPIAEMCFVYIATLYGGSIRFTTPMLWALAFIAEFLIGGVTGIYLGAERRGHLLPRHLLRGRALPLHVLPDRDHRRCSRGITFWFPKMFGRMMNETLGQDPLLGHDHPVQLHLHPAVHPRARRRAPPHLRLHELPRARDARDAGAAHHSPPSRCVVMLLFQFVFLFNFICSMFRGPKAEKNPWKSNTLEWTADSPPPHGNWAEMPDRATAARTSTASPAATTTTGRRTRRREPGASVKTDRDARAAP